MVGVSGGVKGKNVDQVVIPVIHPTLIVYVPSCDRCGDAVLVLSKSRAVRRLMETMSQQEGQCKLLAQHGTW